MNKINVLWTFIITIIICTAAAATVKSNRIEYACAENNRECIAMNDDGQAINGGTHDMWFRVRADGSNDWIYGKERVSPGELSETFLPELKESLGSEIVEKVHVEAIPVSRTNENASDGRLAFDAMNSKPIYHYKGTFR